MYTSKVNEKFDFELKAQDIDQLDINTFGSNKQFFHILKDGKSYNAELIELDAKAKLFQFKVNGVLYKVQVADQYDQLINRLGLSNMNQKKVNDVKAPMPGLVLSIMVAPGDQVTKGSSLLILEAMKMENVLKADGDGVIKSIEVVEGTAVDKNQVLIKME